MRKITSALWAFHYIPWMHRTVGLYPEMEFSQSNHVINDLWMSGKMHWMMMLSNRDGSSFNWKRLWHLTIPNNFKLSGWGACKSILPTIGILKRSINSEGEWTSCQIEPEDLCMPFYLVYLLLQVWKCSTFSVSFLGSLWQFKEWFDKTSSVWSEDDWKLFLIVCYRVWEVRNNVDCQ